MWHRVSGLLGRDVTGNSWIVVRRAAATCLSRCVRLFACVVVLFLSGESDGGVRASGEPVWGGTAEWREVPFCLSMRVLHATGMSTLRSVSPACVAGVTTVG